jgi:hypothetical protein
LDTARDYGWLPEKPPLDAATSATAALRPAVEPGDAPSVPSREEFEEALATVETSLADNAANVSASSFASGAGGTAREPIAIASVYYAPIEAAALRFDVEARLRDRLSSDLFAQFDLFIYVSKAVDGPWAQMMYVFEKKGGRLDLRNMWPVSTGRECNERTPTGRTANSATPAGYFQFDHNRMFRHYRSVQWDAPMPNAMFFNWVDRGRLTAVAIHSATGSGISHLGDRASSGCIRLSPEASSALFQLVREEYRGAAPKVAYNSRTASLSRDGELARGADGNLSYVDSYRVLTVIDTFGGGEADQIF